MSTAAWPMGAGLYVASACPETWGLPWPRTVVSLRRRTPHLADYGTLRPAVLLHRPWPCCCTPGISGRRRWPGTRSAGSACPGRTPWTSSVPTHSAAPESGETMSLVIDILAPRTAYFPPARLQQGLGGNEATLVPMRKLQKKLRRVLTARDRYVRPRRDTEAPAGLASEARGLTAPPFQRGHAPRSSARRPALPAGRPRDTRPAGIGRASASRSTLAATGAGARTRGSGSLYRLFPGPEKQDVDDPDADLDLA
jgi:hypothetical protein